MRLRITGTREPLAYLAAVLLLQVGYAIGGLTAPNPFFGFNQLRFLGPLGVVAALALSWVVGAVLSKTKWPWRGSVGSTRARILLGALLVLAAMAAFYLLRSHSLNPDGVALEEKIPRDVVRYGAHVTHDEMLELFVHSRIYAVAHRLWGWSVALAYQVPDAIAGGAFLVLVLVLSRRIRERRAEFVALVLCGGYVQVFFGDVENYTLVSVLILAYLLLCESHVRGRLPLWVPGLALSIAICFHLLAGWLLPSLLYLVLHYRRLGRRVNMPVLVLALVTPIAALLVYLHFHGLPIQRLFDSSHVSGMGGHYERYIARLRLRYFGGMINTVTLLLPTLVLLPPLLLFRRLGSDPYARFLQIAAGSMLVFTFVWRAQLGVYEDWNLFAPGMIPVAILIAERFSSLELPRLAVIRGALIWTGAVHSLLWVLSNHFRWR